MGWWGRGREGLKSVKFALPLDSRPHSGQPGMDTIKGGAGLPATAQLVYGASVIALDLHF